MNELQMLHALQEALSEPPYTALSLLACVMVAGWILKKYTGQPVTHRDSIQIGYRHDFPCRAGEPYFRGAA